MSEICDPVQHWQAYGGAASTETEPEKSAATDRKPMVSSRIRKRKSRAKKTSETTFITTDPANFRHMVQQVTGPGLNHGPAFPTGRVGSVWAARDSFEPSVDLGSWHL